MSRNDNRQQAESFAIDLEMVRDKINAILAHFEEEPNPDLSRSVLNGLWHILDDLTESMTERRSILERYLCELR